MTKQRQAARWNAAGIALLAASGLMLAVAGGYIGYTMWQESRAEPGWKVCAEYPAAARTASTVEEWYAVRELHRRCLAGE